MAKGETIMYKYDNRDTYMDGLSLFKKIFGLSFYKVDSEKYGITDGFTFHFFGNNFNFEREKQ
jgi:hypothetical protein